MTKSSTPPASDLPKQSPRRPSSGRGRAFLVFLFRLLLLGVSGSLAGLVGITIAQFYPGQIQEPPLVEKLLRGSQTLWRGVTQLPQSWDSSPPEVVSPLPETAEPPASAPDSLPAPPSPQPALTEAQRQQVQTDLNQLQNDLQQLNNRASALATQVGADPNVPVEEKLQTIQRQLDPNAAPPSPSASQSPDQNLITPATSTLSDGELLKVTLPSDALFDGDNTLRSTTAPILNGIVEDLRRYPGATIRVGGHTDSQGSAADDRDRSFEQASAVTQYLSNQLDESYQWVVVGHGGRQPVTDNTSEINRQRNRRIEIVIDPN